MPSLNNPSSLRNIKKTKHNFLVNGADQELKNLTQKNCLLCIHVKGCPIYGIVKMHIEPNTDAIKSDNLAYICKNYEEIETTDG